MSNTHGTVLVNHDSHGLSAIFILLGFLFLFSSKTFLLVISSIYGTHIRGFLYPVIGYLEFCVFGFFQIKFCYNSPKKNWCHYLLHQRSGGRRIFTFKLVWLPIIASAVSATGGVEFTLTKQSSDSIRSP